MSEQSPEAMRPILAALGDAVSALEALPKVVIAAIDGLWRRSRNRKSRCSWAM
jgi:enoyl-CoA hydratase/carnithine racemase